MQPVGRSGQCGSVFDGWSTRSDCEMRRTTPPVSRDLLMRLGDGVRDNRRVGFKDEGWGRMKLAGGGSDVEMRTETESRHVRVK